jgi:alkanesulfonate monooxygenase SsuD/methylene tetrahydromethanopterin reductase-like flavin-dependent oxidoreductase (luciferase family)
MLIGWRRDTARTSAAVRARREFSNYDCQGKEMPLKFGFWSEQETQVGHSYSNRLRELVREARFAEQMGFDFVALSEQHFALGGVSSSAPEVVFGYLAAVTSRIKLRPAVALMPKAINHALRTAERLAATDILSEGRMEMYCGRANTTIAMRVQRIARGNPAANGRGHGAVAQSDA